MSEDAEYFISDDRALLRLDWIVATLQATYWAQGRPADVIRRSLEGSLCFGAYHAPSRSQVGLARIVTDGASFAWLCDVVVDPAHRSRGLGKRLVAKVVSDPCVAPLTILLGTRDAHGLYERYGFVRREMMRRPPAWETPGWRWPGEASPNAAG